LINSVLDAMFFRDIHIDDEVFVLSKFMERRYRKGQNVFFQGEYGHEMFIVKSGVLKIYREGDDKEVILGHQFPGETIGELEAIHYNQSRLASAAALEDSTLWAISRTDLDAIIQLYPNLLRKLFYVICERLSQADRKIDYLSFLDTRLRVINLLLDLHSNFGVETASGSLINWKVTQQHLAFMIGVNRESATRALKDLENEGLIQIQSRLITILDVSTLQKLSNKPFDTTENRQWHSSYRYNITT
jgi:CRP/FNR family cyclic AMP-dependent transcriptional regulator